MQKKCVSIRSVSVLALLILTAGSIAGCGSDDKAAAPSTPQPKTPVAKVEASPADPTAKMAHAVVVGKSGAAVDLKYDVLNKPEIGKPVEIELALIPGAVLDSMTVSLAATTPGLTVISGGEGSFGKLAIGEVARQKFLVTADKEDVLYLTVTATAYAVGLSSTRSFAIPLIFSAPPPAADVHADTPAQKVQTASAPEKKK
jgi:hypothetical protein